MTNSGGWEGFNDDGEVIGVSDDADEIVGLLNIGCEDWAGNGVGRLVFLLIAGKREGSTNELGLTVTDKLGEEVMLEGKTEGANGVITAGDSVGVIAGEEVCDAEAGATVATDTGDKVRATVGCCVDGDTTIGETVGDPDVGTTGDRVDPVVGNNVGVKKGASVGTIVGFAGGVVVGIAAEVAVGSVVGKTVRAIVGDTVGGSVTCAASKVTCNKAANLGTPNPVIGSQPAVA
jgi:hypothetical protein